MDGGEGDGKAESRNRGGEVATADGEFVVVAARQDDVPGTRRWAERSRQSSHVCIPYMHIYRRDHIAGELVTPRPGSLFMRDADDRSVERESWDLSSVFAPAGFGQTFSFLFFSISTP